MTSYSLFNHASAGPALVADGSGNFQAGVIFEATTGGCWFQGWWWWVPTGGDTAPQKFALWCLQTTGGHLVTNAVAMSGTLTANSWNFVPLTTPVQLAIGTAYNACTGWALSHGFPSTSNQFNSGGPLAAGIVNGPLKAFSDQTGSSPGPYGVSQGVFSTGGPDPSVNMPGNGSSGSNFGMDVQISDTAPAGYTGSFRLWPNKFDTNGFTSADSSFPYNVATEFHLSQACTLNYIWYFSTDLSNMATEASVWTVGGNTVAASNTSPAWTNPDGTTPAATGSGWLKCAMTGSLPVGQYRVAVYDSNGTASGWSSTDNKSDYWGTAGTAPSGITNGPLFAPNKAAASTCFDYSASDGSNTPPFSTGTTEPGQSCFGQLPSGAIGIPYLYATGVGGVSQNYWVDAEVSPIQPAPPQQLIIRQAVNRAATY